jgi:hypothetical protein
MLPKPIETQIRHKIRSNLWIEIETKPKDIRFNQFLFYLSYKLGLDRSLSYKYRYQECIKDYNSDLCNKDEVLICNIDFFSFLWCFYLVIRSSSFFSFLLAQICIQISLNTR